VELPPVETEFALAAKIIPGLETFTVAVFVAAPAVAVTVALPALRAVNVAFATPFVVVAVAVIVPIVASSTEKLTVVPSRTVTLEESTTVAVTVAVPLILTVDGTAAKVSVAAVVTLTVVGAETDPTAASMVTEPAIVPAVKMAVAEPLASVVAEAEVVIEPRVVSAILNDTTAPATVAPELSSTVAVMAEVAPAATDAGEALMVMEAAVDVPAVVALAVIPVKSVGPPQEERNRAAATITKIPYGRKNSRLNCFI